MVRLIKLIRANVRKFRIWRLRTKLERAVVHSYEKGTTKTISWNLCTRQTLESDFFMLDETAEDVVSLLSHDRDWKLSHFTNLFKIPSVIWRGGGYSRTRLSNGFRFSADADAEHWVYLLSKEMLPTTYSLEFDYVPHTIFREQLQLCFAAQSLCDRHRFILKFNRSAYYQIVRNGFFLPKLDVVPISIDLHRPTRVRLEVVENEFFLYFDGKPVFLVRDCLYNPRPSRGMLLFWNRREKDGNFQKMDFEIRNYAFYARGNSLK